jgi:hypothetical protein
MLLVVAACEEDRVAPTSALAPAVQILPGAADDGDGQPTHEEFELCKTGSAATFDYTVVVPPGGATTTGTVTLADGECRIIALFGGNGADVTVTERDPAGFDFDHVDVSRIFLGTVSGPFTSTNPTVGPEFISGTNGGGLRGVLAVYTNVPEEGDEGCTPGYWKNHLADWPASGISPSDDFDSTFGVDLFDPDITLGEAVKLGGGGVKKLARHGTAALINAGHPDVGYPLSVAGVIAAVQAGNADALATFNELGCDID